jgi:hypothetical protein
MDTTTMGRGGRVLDARMLKPGDRIGMLGMRYEVQMIHQDRRWVQLRYLGTIVTNAPVFRWVEEHARFLLPEEYRADE